MLQYFCRFTNSDSQRFDDAYDEFVMIVQYIDFAVDLDAQLSYGCRRLVRLFVSAISEMNFFIYDCCPKSIDTQTKRQTRQLEIGNEFLKKK